MNLQDEIRKTGLTNTEFAKEINLPKTRLMAILSGDLSKPSDVSKISKALGIDLVPAKKSNLKPCKGVTRSKANNPVSAEGKSCVQCGVDDNTISPCHYTGLRQMAFGKGTGQKCNHKAVADLCNKCHTAFDQPINRKSIEASLKFLIAIFKTRSRIHGTEFDLSKLKMNTEDLEVFLFNMLLLIIKESN